jgi:glycogen synthase
MENIVFILFFIFIIPTGRLAPQKGVDLIEEIFPWLLAHDQTGKGVTGQVQLVMMGSGEERYANFLRRAGVLLRCC